MVRSTVLKLKIVACNANQTRTPYSRSRNRDLDSKNILTRPGIPCLEREFWLLDDPRAGQLHREKGMTKVKFLHAVAILSMMIATLARSEWDRGP